MPKQHDTAQLARWQIQPVTHVVFTSVLMEHVGLGQRSYSTLGPVSAWVGDRLRTGKLPRRRTRHPGLLSQSQSSVAGWNEYPAKAGEVNRHIVWYTSPYSRPHSVVLVPGYIDWLEKISADLWGSSSAYEACSQRCAIQNHCYNTLLYFSSGLQTFGQQIMRVTGRLWVRKSPMQYLRSC